MFTEILVGLFLRGILIQLASRVTKSEFLLFNKVINSLGVACFVASIFVSELPFGNYFGFFLIDILAVIVIFINFNKNEEEEEEGVGNNKKRTVTRNRSA